MENNKKTCEQCGAPLEFDEALDQYVCQYCGGKVMMDDDVSKAKRLEQAKLEARKQTHEQNMKERNDKLQQELKEQKMIEEAQAKKKFKKGFASKLLLVLFVLSIILFFSTNGFLVKALLAVQAGLWIVAWLMGMQILPEKKHGLRVILTIIAFVLFFPIISIGPDSSSNKQKVETIVWEDLLLHASAPEPSWTKGVVEMDDSENLSVDYMNVDKKSYKAYIDACKKMGYTMDLTQSGSHFNAYDKKGGEVVLYYDEDEEKLAIHVNAPRVFEESEWPTRGLASLLPKPNSTKMDIITDDELEFSAYIGSMDKKAYAQYVKACEDAGFVKEYSKTDTSYEAYNDQKVLLTMHYVGGGVVSIDLEQEEATTPTTDQKEEKPSKPAKPAEPAKPQANTGIRPDFKQAMDDYEAVMNAYVTFMQSYDANSGVEAVVEYGKYLDKVAKAEQSFAKWENEDLNEAELAYYLEVQTRISEKLLTVQ